VIRTSAYIIACSARNRLRVRLRRLREPRYLIGAVVGAAYIYFSFFARFRARTATRRRAREAVPPTVELVALTASGPAVAGLLLMVVTALGWLVPFDSGLLAFSNPEIQFLFPAPVSRRSLLIYPMMRSQVGMLFGSLVVAVASPAATGYTRLRVAIGIWLLMCTWKVYFTGISLARARLRAHDARLRRIAWLPLTILVTALAVVAFAVWRSLQGSAASVTEFLDRVGGVARDGAASVVLWPFVAVARPLFAPWPGPYLGSLIASAFVLAAVAVWVVLSDSAFQDVVEERAARKDGEKKTPAASYRLRYAGWQLATHGPPEAIFAWKAATQSIRLVDRASAIRMGVAFGAFALASVALGRRSGWSDAFAAFALAGAVFSIVLGPQAIRIDMRQDLQHLELIKTWPVSSSAIVRGQLIWPGAMLTVAAWTLIGLAFLHPLMPLGAGNPVARVSAVIAALVIAPALIFGQLAIHNGMALLFPAWVPQGAQRARGLDAMGQRIIVLGGTWLTLGVMLIPGVILAGIVWFALQSFVGAAAWVPAACIVTAAMLVEVLVATELLGPAYDRLDVTSVERSEE
jgi:putative ABC exporter